MASGVSSERPSWAARGHQAAHQLVFGHIEQQDIIEPLAALPECPVDQLGLRGSAREPVEDGPLLRFRLRELRLDHVENDAVGDQLALVHVLLRFAAEGRLVPDGRAQEVAGRDLREAEPLGEDLALRALSRSGRA
jgi:hypothetical protein